MGSTPHSRGFLKAVPSKPSQLDIQLCEFLNACVHLLCRLSQRLSETACLQGFFKLLRCWMRVGVLKGLQMMSELKTCMNVSAQNLFKVIFLKGNYPDYLQVPTGTCRT